MASPPLLLLLLLLLLSIAAPSTAFSLPIPQLAHLHFWFHEFQGGPNSTAVRIVVTNLTTGFGGVSGYDNLMAATTDASSTLLGRIEGISIGVSVDGARRWTSANFIINKGKFAGSTFTVTGNFVVAGDMTERVVVGGTGAFRLCRGFALNYKVFSTSYGLKTEFDVYIWYYPGIQSFVGGGAADAEDGFQLHENEMHGVVDGVLSE